MIEIKICNKLFKMEKVDWLAQKFYDTKEKKYANILICTITPYIKKIANSVCKNPENAKEAEQEVKMHLWELFFTWIPKENNKFSHLMKKDIHGSFCNFMGKSDDAFISHRKVRGAFVNIIPLENFIEYNYDFVREFENRDLVEKLLKLVDSRTKKIFEIMLQGSIKNEHSYFCKHSPNYAQIGKELGITGMTVKRKIEKCKPLILKLLGERNF